MPWCALVVRLQVHSDYNEKLPFRQAHAEGGCYEIQNAKLQKLGDLRNFANRRIYFIRSRSAFAGA
jgi:hypothetical protein